MSYAPLQDAFDAHADGNDEDDEMLCGPNIQLRIFGLLHCEILWIVCIALIATSLTWDDCFEYSLAHPFTNNLHPFALLYFVCCGLVSRETWGSEWRTCCWCMELAIYCWRSWIFLCRERSLASQIFLSRCDTCLEACEIPCIFFYFFELLNRCFSTTMQQCRYFTFICSARSIRTLPWRCARTAATVS